MSDYDKLRLERELAHPGTYGEAKVRHREWNLAEYRENYDAVIQRVRDTRDRTDAEIDGLRADLEEMHDRLARACDCIRALCTRAGEALIEARREGRSLLADVEERTRTGDE